MELNIHPIFVHFPIALLSLYAVFEILPWRRLQETREWFFVKATFLLIGALATLPTIATGLLAASLASEVTPLLERHALFAIFTSLVFLCAANRYVSVLKKFLKPAADEQVVMPNRKISIIIALIGLVLVFTTGALGGALVYGPEGDPFISFIYGILL